MSYAGPNQPVAPTDDPYQMYQRLYGQLRDRDSLLSVLDVVRDDLKRVSRSISAEDKRLLEEHAEFVRQMEQEFGRQTASPSSVIRRNSRSASPTRTTMSPA